MRNALFLAVACTAISAQAALFPFDLGPDNGLGFGLNGANERPTPNASPATGDEIKDIDSSVYIQYDNVAKQLELHFAWGQDFDYENGGINGTDLSDNPGTAVDLSGIHIHGPADANSSAGILYDLLTLAGTGFFNPNIHGRNGAIDMTLQLVDNPNGTTFTIAQQEAQLLGNNWYINIHSTTFPGGEIRGQLLNAIPEPEHYAAFAGLALLGFAGYRRFKAAPAA